MKPGGLRVIARRPYPTPSQTLKGPASESEHRTFRDYHRPLHAHIRLPNDPLRLSAHGNRSIFAHER